MRKPEIVSTILPIVLAVALSVAAPTEPAYASGSWRQTLNEAAKAFKKGDFQTMREQGLSAVKSLESEGGKDRDLAEALTVTGQAYQRRRRQEPPVPVAPIVLLPVLIPGQPVESRLSDRSK